MTTSAGIQTRPMANSPDAGTTRQCYEYVERVECGQSSEPDRQISLIVDDSGRESGRLRAHFTISVLRPGIRFAAPTNTK
jgi:hypothetical protein